MTQTQQPVSFRLTNGLRVHYYHRLGETIGLGLGIPVGAWQDPAGKDGLAHMLEHFVFCGSTEWAEDERSREIELHGAHFNGVTSHDHTFYWLALPGAELQFGVKYLKKLVFEPTFPIKLLERERARIALEAGPQEPKFIYQLENKVMGWGFNLDLLITARKLSHYLFARATGSDSRIIGFVSTRKQIAVDDLRDFHKRYYVPNYAALLVLGDVNLEELTALIEEHFGHLTPANQTPDTRSPVPKTSLRSRPHIFHSHGEYDARYIAIGYNFPPPLAKDLGAMLLTRNLIVEEIIQRFNRESKTPNHLESKTQVYRQTCFFELMLRVDKAYAKLAEKELLLLLEELRTGKFGEQRFERERQSALNAWLMYGQVTGHYLEYLSGLPHTYTDTPPPLPHLAIKSVELNDVRRMAARMLNLNRRILILHRPKPLIPIILAGLLIAALLYYFL